MSQRKRSPKDIFCPIPFIGVYFRGNDHHIQSCCWEQVNHKGDKKNHTIENYSNSIMTYWQSPTIKSMRKHFMAGRWPASCIGCKKIENAGKKSPRQDWIWAWRL